MPLDFTEVLGFLAFSIIPPVFWAVGSLLALTLLANKTKMPASAAVHFGMILVLTYATALGGVFNQIGAGLAVLTGGVFVLGVIKILRR
ncbi:hypothetical protein LCGC14_2025270 [marine sediment metagenome]|uniref:Uncharacterized protein n=1 Tax=marine sediment metagenome TaxID=412755 RepID=A0A0F9H9P3_9ZZZZ